MWNCRTTKPLSSGRWKMLIKIERGGTWVNIEARGKKIKVDWKVVITKITGVRKWIKKVETSQWVNIWERKKPRKKTFWRLSCKRIA